MSTMIECPISRRSTNHHEKDNVKMGHSKKNISCPSSNRKVLAHFLEKLPHNKGWWYRSPEYSLEVNNIEDAPKIDSDNVMPHFGTLFGLSEPASAIILAEMGCLKYNKEKKRTEILKQGWEDLASEFRIKKVELETTKFKNNKRRYFIRFGHPPKEYRTPTLIYNGYKKSTKSISSKWFR